VYGVVSQRVRERTREIGIRVALGGSTPRVVAWAAGSGVRLIATGVVSGLIFARVASGALDGLLFGITAHDVVTTTAVAAAMAGLGLVATIAPAWRATRVDPVRVLRRG
jgi:ABC-type lipoprotein release transport system permease subunit